MKKRLTDPVLKERRERDDDTTHIDTLFETYAKDAGRYQFSDQESRSGIFGQIGS